MPPLGRFALQIACRSMDAPNVLWVADITFVPTWAGLLYLAVVLDAFSRRVVGWAMGTRQRTQLVLDAMNMAVAQRKPDNVIHHSDQGSQYTSVAFGLRCKEMGIGPSMGSVGDCYDNAPLDRLLRNRLPGSACVRASSPRSNASFSTGGSSRPRQKPALPASSSSKAVTPPLANIRLWGISHRSTKNGPPLKGSNLSVRNRPQNRGNFNSSISIATEWAPLSIQLQLHCCRPGNTKRLPRIGNSFVRFLKLHLMNLEQT